MVYSYLIRVRVRVGPQLPRLIVELGEVPLFDILLAALPPTRALTSCQPSDRAALSQRQVTGLHSAKGK